MESEKKSVAILLREFLLDDPTLLNRPDVLLKKLEPEISGSMSADFRSLQTAFRDGVGRIFASINPNDGEALNLAVKTANSVMENSLNDKRRKFIIDTFLFAIKPATPEEILEEIPEITGRKIESKPAQKIESKPAEKFEPQPAQKSEEAPANSNDSIKVEESALEEKNSKRMTVDDHHGGEQIVFTAQQPRSMDNSFSLPFEPTTTLEPQKTEPVNYFSAANKKSWGEEDSGEYLYAENYDQKDTHESSNTILIMMIVLATVAVIFVIRELMA